MRIDHDGHVHTVLSSCCRDERSVPAALAAEAAAAGLSTICLTDHCWDASMPGASSWYRPQTVERLLEARRSMSAAPPRGVRVLWGCETEYAGPGKVGLTRDAARKFDFVLLPFTHFHMKGFVVPEGLRGAAEVARLMVERFREAVVLGVASGLAHPFLPCGYTDHADAILGRLSSAELADCFGLAAHAGLSIEISASMFPGAGAGEKEGFHDETFLRVLAAAKQAGCVFHFGSDSHSLDGVAAVRRLGPYAAALGIGPEDVHPLFRQVAGTTPGA